MRLVVGLGNPGPEYHRTRHNVGYRVIDAFAAKHRIELPTHEKDAMTGRGRVAGRALMLAKPLTFMNLSGKAVSSLVRAHLDSLEDLLVVYDEIDLPLGRLRLRERGSAGTHNGMDSIVESLDTGHFPRLRFGIRGSTYSKSVDLARYVLEDFEPEEEPIVEEGVAKACDAILLFARGDLRRAMNTFNREPEPEGRSDDDPTPPDAG
ncbi:MAG TPA: aminoacyl-tRNA hydrolase [Thermoanaerobaculia bacterium]|nr:aminoacyl-tRNA hydrolase [Thermoanaerobaculia bacterium]